MCQILNSAAFNKTHCSDNGRMHFEISEMTIDKKGEDSPSGGHSVCSLIPASCYSGWKWKLGITLGLISHA